MNRFASINAYFGGDDNENDIEVKLDAREWKFSVWKDRVYVNGIDDDEKFYFENKNGKPAFFKKSFNWKFQRPEIYTIESGDLYYDTINEAYSVADMSWNEFFNKVKTGVI